jgi:hypothetical protein
VGLTQTIPVLSPLALLLFLLHFVFPCCHPVKVVQPQESALQIQLPRINLSVQNRYAKQACKTSMQNSYANDLGCCMARLQAGRAEMLEGSWMPCSHHVTIVVLLVSSTMRRNNLT